MNLHDEVPWEAYVRSVVEIVWNEETVVRVEPRPLGVTEGRYPDAVEVVHVITAQNPASNVLASDENARRNAELERALRQAGWAWRPAVGASADPDDPWEEASFAVADERRADVVEVARRFGQAAVYEWTPRARAVVPTDAGTAVHEHGWRSTWA